MLKNKTIFSLSLLAAAMALTACQPKNTEPQEDKVTQSQTMAQAEVLKLAGDVEKLTLNLPECKGNNCPEMNIERLSSNQPFIDEFIDQQILKRLDQTLDISAKSLKTNPPAVSAEESAASSPVQADEIGRASCRERVRLTVVAVD